MPVYNATTDPSGLSLTLGYQSNACNSGCGAILDSGSDSAGVSLTIRSLSAYTYLDTLNIYNGNSTSAALMASLGSSLPRYTPGSLT